jgi:hypothetical protein
MFKILHFDQFSYSYNTTQNSATRLKFIRVRGTNEKSRIKESHIHLCRELLHASGTSPWDSATAKRKSNFSARILITHKNAVRASWLHSCRQQTISFF